jgi:eukaryotic-like serine/threonine-protein kinase
MRLSLIAGEVVANRFELEREVLGGAMGRLFRARDRHGGALVALKVVEGEPDRIARFRREAALLADLDHPGIVRHVAHGELPAGELFLAMEWLEGEDLSARLARGRLSAWETVVLLSRVADALALVHARGIIHRDIKPSNLFIPAGRIDSVKVLESRASPTARRSPRRESGSARRSTWRQSRCAAPWTSTRAPTCSRSARSSSSA